MTGMRVASQTRRCPRKAIASRGKARRRPAATCPGRGSAPLLPGRSRDPPAAFRRALRPVPGPARTPPVPRAAAHQHGAPVVRSGRRLTQPRRTSRSMVRPSAVRSVCECSMSTLIGTSPSKAWMIRNARHSCSPSSRGASRAVSCRSRWRTISVIRYSGPWGSPSAFVSVIGPVTFLDPLSPGRGL